MKRFRFTKLFSSILAFFMVLSLLVPFSSASTEESKPFKQNGQNESTIQLKAAIAEQLSLSKYGPILNKSYKTYQAIKMLQSSNSFGMKKLKDKEIRQLQ